MVYYSGIKKGDNTYERIEDSGIDTLQHHLDLRLPAAQEYGE